MPKIKGGDAVSKEIIRALGLIQKELKTTNKYLKELVETKPDRQIDSESVMIDTTEINNILNRESTGTRRSKIDGYNG